MVNLNYKNFLVVLLGLTTIAGGIFAWSQFQELVKLRADGLSDSARADLQKRLWATEKRKNELEAELAGLRARGESPAMVNAEGEPAADDAAAPGRPGAGRFNRREGMNNLATLLDNPEFDRLWNAQQKFALDGRYSALFKNLNLSVADLDKFKSLLVEKQSAVLDVMAAAREQGLNPRDPADRTQLATLLQSAQAQVDNNIRQALGDSQYAQYQNYEQTLPQRSVVSQLAQSLSYSGSPLQDAQAEQLVNILATNTPVRSQSAGGGNLFAAFGGGGGPMAGFFGNRAAPITDAAITQAGAVLTAPQVTALQQLQAQQQAQSQIAKIIRQASSGGSAAPGAAGAPATQGGASPPSAAPKPPGG
jgi:hypothetical protein